MATLTLSDYQTFHDLTRSESVQIEFNLPEDFVEGTARAIPILMFRVDASDNCECWVHVNDSIPDRAFSNASIRLSVQKNEGHKTVHELLKGTGFRRNSPNQILISKAPGTPGSSLFISDIVLFYQRRINI